MRDQTATILFNGTILHKEIEVTLDLNDRFCAFVNITRATINMSGVGNETASTEYFAEDECDLDR